MTLRQIGQLILMSALWGAVFMLIKYGLVDFSPVEVAFFAPLLDRSAEINRIQALGLMVGLVGVALVVGVQAVSTLGQLLGAVAVLGAAASGAISNFVVKLQYRDKSVPPTTTTFFSLSVGAVLVAPFAYITASGDAPGARPPGGDTAAAPPKEGERRLISGLLRRSIKADWFWWLAGARSPRLAS